MRYLDERRLLIDYGVKLIEKKLTRGTGGNLSIYDHENNLMIITPSGIGYHETKLDDLVILNRDGQVIEGHRKPSSEYLMHLEVYKNRPEFNALIHTHSTYATTLSVLNKPLPAVDYLIALAGGNDVPIAKYASFGTQELANNAVDAMRGRSAVILANHGLNVAGKTLEQSFNDLEIIEFCCELYIRALSAGIPVILDDEEMVRMVKDFETYGQ